MRNGFTAWVVLLVHAFGGWARCRFCGAERGGNWYDFGLLVGPGSPLLGLFNRAQSSRRR